MTHTPKNPYCFACATGKAKRKPSRRKGKALGDHPKGPREQYTGDHLVGLDEEDEEVVKMGIDPNKVCLIMADRGPAFSMAYPDARKSAKQSIQAALNFAPPNTKPGIFHSDGSKELRKMAIQLEWCHDTAGPGQHAKVAERYVQKILQGTHCGWTA